LPSEQGLLTGANLDVYCSFIKTYAANLKV
jgi:hypothetical protein